MKGQLLKVIKQGVIKSKNFISKQSQIAVYRMDLMMVNTKDNCLSKKGYRVRTDWLSESLCLK
jgi:hypothetical protein